MVTRAHPVFFVLFVLLVAPAGAAVVVAALLLFGLQPHLVFAPGLAVKSFLHARGVQSPSAVGVLVTVGLWWVMIVTIGVMWDRRRNRRAT